jgi:hypothetical protein
MTDDDAYKLLGQLVSEMPQELFDRGGVLRPQHHLWLGRAINIAKEYLTVSERVLLTSASTNLDGVLKTSNAQSLSVLLHLALANAEAKASTPLRGMFLAAASPFDALMNIGKVLREAQQDVLIVDPYADESLLDEFSRQANVGVSIRVLSETGKFKSTLGPARDRWVEQFGTERPIQLRASKVGSLHDRLIVVDSREAWAIGQSFNQLAKRASTTILRIDTEPAGLKIAAMDSLWAEATTI